MVQYIQVQLYSGFTALWFDQAAPVCPLLQLPARYQSEGHDEPEKFKNWKFLTRDKTRAINS